MTNMFRVAIVGVGLACVACGSAGQRGQVRSGASATHWVHDALGLEVPIPAGWSIRRIKGNEVLVGRQHDGFANNINVAVLPRNGMTLDALRLETKRVVASQLPHMSLDRAVIEPIAGRPMLVVEFHGRLQQASRRMHIRSATYLRADKQIVVTATVAAATWPALQPLIDGVFAGLVVRAEP